jgi:hypothetical protein
VGHAMDLAVEASVQPAESYPAGDLAGLKRNML